MLFLRSLLYFIISPCLSSFSSSSFHSSSSLPLSPSSLAVLYGYESSFSFGSTFIPENTFKNEHPNLITCCCGLRRSCRHPRHHLCLICLQDFPDFSTKEDSVCVFHSLRSRACRVHRKPTQCYPHL